MERCREVYKERGSEGNRKEERKEGERELHMCTIGCTCSATTMFSPSVMRTASRSGKPRPLQIELQSPGSFARSKSSGRSHSSQSYFFGAPFPAPFGFEVFLDAFGFALPRFELAFLGVAFTDPRLPLTTDGADSFIVLKGQLVNEHQID